MIFIGNVKITKGYDHWKNNYIDGQIMRDKIGLKTLAYGHAKDDVNWVWNCFEFSGSRDQLMQAIGTEEFIKLREAAGADLSTQQMIELVE